jgi:hypothetical protein
MALAEDEYAALTPDGRKAFKARKLRVAYDVCRIDGEGYKSTEASGDRPLVDSLRAWLELDGIEWDDKPLEYHAKANPLHFLRPTWRILRELKQAGRRGFSLLPLRRTLTPRYTTIDTKALRVILGLGESEQMSANRKTAAAKRQRLDPDDPEYGKRAKKRTPQELEGDHWAAWDTVFDFRNVLRAELCGLHPKNKRKLVFGFSMTTDGVGCSLKFTLPAPPKGQAPPPPPTEMPKRGLWAIDELKHLYRCGPPPKIPEKGDGSSPQDIAAALDSHLKAIQAVGVDPGKNELAVAADSALARGSQKIRVKRYTAAQRRFQKAPYRYLYTDKVARRGPRPIFKELRHDLVGPYARHTAAKEGHTAFVKKPTAIADLEHTLATTDAQTHSVAAFGAYVTARSAVLAPLLAHYEQLHHRKLRWHGRREGERSIAKFIQQLKDMKRPEKEHMVIAWGAWGMVAGRPGQAVNRGKAPCLGVGLMKRVAKELCVVKTPEHMTSQKCCRCGGHCGRHSKVEANRRNDHPWWTRRHEIRGLRLCENSQCRKPLNRDANAAVNIGTNFLLLFCGLPPIASMNTEEAELTALQAAEPQEETE